MKNHCHSSVTSPSSSSLRLRSHHSSQLAKELIQMKVSSIVFSHPQFSKLLQCGRRSSKYQSYKACGHLGRRRSTSMDKRRRGGGQGRVRTQWLSEVSASVAHCTAPSSSPPGHGKFISCCRLEIKELSRPPLFILLMRLDVESKSDRTMKS